MILQLGFKFSTVNSFVLKKLYKEEGSFSKRRGSCYFPPRKLWAAIVQSSKKLYAPPSQADFELSSPTPSVCTFAWAYADVTTKIFRMDR